MRKEFQREGKEVLPKVDTEVQDSNIITPGTKFMYALSKALQDYIHKKLNNDAGWKDIKVFTCFLCSIYIVCLTISVIIIFRGFCLISITLHSGHPF